MESYEKFISEPKLLEETFRTIQKKKIPDKFDRNFLGSVGLDEPNTIFYVRLFKNLNLITEDGRPHPTYYAQFVKSGKEAKRLVARQMKNTAYKKVFEENDQAYNLPKEEIRSIFKKLIGPHKSNTIVRLAADTFSALAKYANWNFESFSKGTQKSMQSETNFRSNEKTEQASSPHEEFLLELMRGEVDHQYSYDGSLAAEDKSDEDKNTQRYHQEQTETISNATQSTSVNEKESYDRKLSSTQNQPPKNAESRQDAINIFVQALQRKAELLERLDRVVEAVNAYDNLITHADKDNYPIESEKIMSAYYKKATLLDDMNNYEEALEHYDHLIRRFS